MKTASRRLGIPLAALAATLALEALAQGAPRPRPPGTVPLQEPPPPPAMVEKDPTLEPEVTTRTEGGQTIQEYRIRGKLYMQRVTPKNGRPYVLMDHRGKGEFTRLDDDLDKLRVPQWVLLEF